MTDKEAKEIKLVVKALDLASFEQPSPSSPALKHYAGGAKVTVVEEKDGWAQLKDGSWVQRVHLDKA